MSLSLLAAAAHGESTPAWAMLAYLAAGVFFILALRGLSSPASSRAGNRNGMIGMAIALVTTLVTHDIANIVEIGIAIFLGGIIGVTIARRIAMTAELASWTFAWISRPNAYCSCMSATVTSVIHGLARTSSCVVWVRPSAVMRTV